LNKLSGNWPAHQTTTLNAAPTHPVLLQLLKLAERNVGQAYMVNWMQHSTTYFVEVLVISEPMRARTGMVGAENIRWVYGEYKNQERSPIWTHFTGDLGLIVELIGDSSKQGVEESKTTQANTQQMPTPDLAKRTGRFNALKLTKNALPTISPSTSTGNVNLSGELSKVELTGILQSISICKMTGRLDLQDTVEGIEIYLEDGNPVHACQIKMLNIVDEKPIVGDPVLLSALIWQSGSFSFNPERKTSERTIRRKLEVLLLEGACLKDYSTYLDSANVKSTSVLHNKLGALSEEAFADKMSAGMPIDFTMQKKVYDSLDGKVTLADVIHKLGLQKPVWIPIVFNLLSCNLISLEGQAATQKRIPEAETVIDPRLITKAERELTRYETGFLSFPLFMLFLQRELDRYGDCKMPFALVIFEIWHKNEAMSNEKLQRVASSFRAIAASYDIIGHYRDFEFAMLLPLKGENECREFVEIFQKFVADSIDPGDNSDAIKMTSGIVTADDGYEDSLDHDSFVRAAVRAKQANKKRRSNCTSARQLHWEELKQQAEAQADSEDLEVVTSLWKKLYEESMHLQFDKQLYWTRAAHEYAKLLAQAGRYSQVVPILSDLLCFKTDQLGPDHITTIGTAGELAHCYYAQGRYDDAELLSQGVLSAFEKHYGSEAPIVAAWYYNLASLFYVQQKYAKAEPMYKKSLDTRKKILGPDHPDTKKSQASYDSLMKILNPEKDTADEDGDFKLITGSWKVYQPETDQSVT